MSVELVTVVQDDADMRIDRWFKQHYPNVGFGQLAKALRTGQIRVNGKRVKQAHRVAAGDEVRVPPFKASEGGGNAASPKPKPALKISDADRQMMRDMVLHEDDAVIVLNKPAGLAVQGGTKTEKHIDGLLPALVAQDAPIPKLVHRLDRDTSGALVLAKTAPAARALTKSFRARDAVKTYVALTVGVPEPEEGVIDAALAKGAHGAGRERMGVVDARDEDAKFARTRYRVMERAAQRAAVVALQPLTGRTHQLRAHMVYIGTPIQGDGKYGGQEAFIDGVPKQLHLHAASIDIEHPNGGRLRVYAPLPKHMKKTWEFFTFEPFPAFAFDDEPQKHTGWRP